MNSGPSKSGNNNPHQHSVIDPAFHRNRVRSLTFLAILALALVVAILLSLRAGSYETPVSELILYDKDNFTQKEV